MLKGSKNGLVTGVCNPQPGMALNTAQHKIVSSLKTPVCSSVFFSVCVCTVVQDNSSSGVAQRHQKVGRPGGRGALTLLPRFIDSRTGLLGERWFSFSQRCCLCTYCVLSTVLGAGEMMW